MARSTARASPGQRAPGPPHPVVTIIPRYPGISVPPRSSLEDTARSNSVSQLTCAALDALIPVIYGEARPAALLANAIVNYNYWIFWLIWCEGECDSITGFTLNDDVVPAGSYVAHYLGTAAGALDSVLAAAFASQGITGFAEKLPGICYSVVGLPVGAVTSTPRFNATIKGQKCYDPRDGTQTYGTPSTWKWTDNPSLHLFSFLENKLWGARKTVVQSTVTTCANANDTVIGSGGNTEKSRTSSVVIDREAGIDSYLDTLRAAASCFIVENQGQIKLVPDADGSPVATYSHASGQILALDKPELRDPSSLPTVIEVTYTDKTTLPWKDATTTPVKRPGVDAGTTPYRKQNLQMLWVTNPSQAAREAVERLNKLWLRSVTFTLRLMDEGLTHEPGDLIAVTYPDLALSSFAARVIAAEPSEQGWNLALERHDPGAYSTTVQPGPTTPLTTLPLPQSPPAVTGVAAVCDVFLSGSGAYASRWIVSWTAPDYPPQFIQQFLIEVSQAGAIVHSGSAGFDQTAYTTPALPEIDALGNQLGYVISVSIISVLQVRGTAGTFSGELTGKLAKPGDIGSLTGFEVGGEVRLSWADWAGDEHGPIDLDWTATEIRYGATGGSWETATLLDRVAAPGVSYVTKSVAAGTWRFWVKALDSVRTPSTPFGQESLNATYVDIIVTSDAGAFVAVDYDYASPSLYKFSAGPDYWISDSAATWNATLTSNVNTYTNPLVSYFAPTTSALLTEIEDHLASITADWYATSTYTDLSGTAERYLELNNTGAEGTKTVSGATNATPIEITTSAAHSYSTGDEVVIAGVGGNTAANGRWIVTVTATDKFTLQDFAGNNVAGNGTKTTDGTSARWSWFSYSAMSAKTTARYSRIRLRTTGIAKVTNLGHIRANVIAKREGGTALTLVSKATVVTFAGVYNKAVAANATPVFDGSPDASRCVVDMIEVSGGRGLTALANQYLLRFNGSSDYVAVGDYATYEFGGAADAAFTVECWLKLSSIGAAQCVISKGSGINSTGSYEVRVGAAGKVQFILIDATAVAYVNCASTTLLVPDLWYHIACTYSGSAPTTPGNLKIYLNGALETTNLITSGTYTRMRDTAVPLEFGRHNAGDSWLDGRLDEVRIWSSARTQANIVHDMFIQSGFDGGGTPVGRWGFDEDPATATTSTTDAGSGAHNGTLSGGPPIRRPYNGMNVLRFNASGTLETNANLKMAWTFDGV